MDKKILIVDSRIYIESEIKLNELGYKLIKLDKQKGFDEAVSAHPDMFALKVKDTWFVDSCVNNMFTFADSKTVCIRDDTNGFVYKYPYDITFNCAGFGNYLVCNKRHTANEIIRFAEENGINVINTKQGYAKCSICIVSDNAIITEDEDILKNCNSKGIDVLKVHKGYVKLYGYNYGFIGGCCGLIEKNILAFNGNVKKHPDYKSIKEFCDFHNVDIISLCDKELYDIGSILRA
ncbi:MAG: hypothetical protein E7600_05960 [Ruminococcaceae bacterium]|nr:hypothetical protein [Oscillospiraceae bacterium]